MLLTSRAARRRAVVGTVLVAVAVAVVMSLAPLLFGMAASPPARIAVFLGLYAAMAALTLGAHRLDGLSKLGLGFSRARSGRQVAIGAALAAALLILVVGIPVAVGVDPADIVGSGNTLIFAALSAVVVGTGEELLFRGYLLGRLTVALRSPVAALAISSALFGLSHLPLSGSWAQVAVTTGIGAVLAAGRIWLPGCSLLSLIVAHALYDFSLAVIAGSLS